MNAATLSQSPKSAPAERDPARRTQDQPDRAAGKTDFNGRTYYFCGLGCKKKFDSDPERYLQPKPAPPLTQLTSINLPTDMPGGEPSLKAEPAAAQYTCPMHQEVRQKGPG